MLFLAGKSAYYERQPLWSKSCVNNAYLLGCLNFVWQKSVLSESCGKCVSFLIHMIYYWTSSQLDMAEVHISICELLPESKCTTPCFLRHRQLIYNSSLKMFSSCYRAGMHNPWPANVFYPARDAISKVQETSRELRQFCERI